MNFHVHVKLIKLMLKYNLYNLLIHEQMLKIYLLLVKFINYRPFSFTEFIIQIKI